MTCGLTRQSLMNISSSWTNQQATTAKTLKKATSAPTKLNALEINAMTAKCLFCNDTKIEPGIPGPCIWCEEIGPATTGAVERFTIAKLRYAGGAEHDVRYVSEAHYDAALGREAASANDLSIWKQKACEAAEREAALLEEASCLKAVLNGMEFKQVDDMVSDGVDACLFLGQESARIIKGIQAERAALREELESIKASVDGYDSPEHSAQVADELGHQCNVLQQRLTVAERRAGELERLIDSGAARDVLSERRRQIMEEHRLPSDDDDYTLGQLAWAASGYAAGSTPSHQAGGTLQPTNWPLAPRWWKPGAPRQMLIKSGALILAEIERIDRAALKPAAEGEGS